MKKFIATIIAVLSFATAVCLSGCKFNFKSFTEDFFKDGYFEYYYVEKVDRYAIVGDGDEPYPETLVIPAYYNDKDVGVYYVKGGFESYTVGPTLRGTKTVYYPYTSELYNNNNLRFNPYEANPSKVFYPNNNTRTFLYPLGNGVAYVSPLSFSKQLERYPNDVVINGYIEIFNDALIYQIANTSYMFNYNEEPNGGYFFINDFERGGLIEDTPYEPKREGYTFDGWYKESACINKWDFATDRLPEAEYDEDGYVTDFVETRLYAKWKEIKPEEL